MEGVLHSLPTADFPRRLRKLKGEHGGNVCPVGLVDADAQRAVVMEAEATEYGMSAKPSARLLDLFRQVRIARHEAREFVEMLREQAKERRK